jgi:streptogramin lyase
MTPVGVAYGDGSVWVINERDKTFQRIDPVSGAELVARSALGTPTGVAWGEEALWITNGFGNPEGGTPVVRVEPTDATPRVFFDAPGGKSIVVAFASVWVGDETRGVVRRYEALTGSELAAISIEGGGPLALAVGTGAAEGIWVADPLNDRVHLIDPETDEVTSSIEVADPTAVAAGDAGVWVTSGANDTITRFDPDGTTIATLSLARGVDVPDAPSTLVIAGDSVWVASDAETLVTRVDVRTNQIVGSLPTTGVVDAMTVDDTGDVWLTVRAP